MGPQRLIPRTGITQTGDCLQRSYIELYGFAFTEGVGTCLSVAPDQLRAGGVSGVEVVHLDEPEKWRHTPKAASERGLDGLSGQFSQPTKTDEARRLGVCEIISGHLLPPRMKPLVGFDQEKSGNRCAGPTEDRKS